MEIEHINEDTIRVRLKKSDLEEMGISFVELMSDQRQIELFFHQVLDEADLEEQFKDSDSVTFQVMPVADGFDLFISKNMGFQEELAQELEKIFPDGFNDSEKSKTDDKIKDSNSKKAKVSTPIFEFENFEAVIALAHRLQKEDLPSALFEMNGKYYISFGEREQPPSMDSKMKMNLSIALEYGQVVPYTLAFMHEHAQVLMKQKAISQINEYF